MISARDQLPWWLKMCLKIALARLPVDYNTWQKLGVFRHGQMDSADYALRVFDKHAHKCGMHASLEGATVLELGPGDSIATAIIAHCHGARAILVDVGRFASAQTEVYQRIVKELSCRRGVKGFSLDGASEIEQVLERCRASYMTGGLADLKRIPDQSVDLIFSQAVLEHVRRHEFSEVMQECCRVLKATGAASHVIDLKDHLGGAANNLRLSHRLWESEFLSSSGFYTNRLRCSEVLDRMMKAGFKIKDLAKHKHDSLPISRAKVHPDIFIESDDDLLVREVEVVLVRA